MGATPFVADISNYILARNTLDDVGDSDVVERDGTSDSAASLGLFTGRNGFAATVASTFAGFLSVIKVIAAHEARGRAGSLKARLDVNSYVGDIFGSVGSQVWDR